MGWHSCCLIGVFLNLFKYTDLFGQLQISLSLFTKYCNGSLPVKINEVKICSSSSLLNVKYILSTLCLDLMVLIMDVIYFFFILKSL